MSGKNRLFFVTDIHGSDRCFRIFLNSAKFYKAQSLILGGDITGKVMVPIVHEQSGRWTADYLGERKQFDKENKLLEFEKMLADTGIYSTRMTRSEYDETENDKLRI